MNRFCCVLKNWVILSLAFLSLSGLTLQASPLSPEQKAFHLLNRLSYGPRPGEVEALVRKGDAGIDAWINEQLHPETISDFVVENKLKEFQALSMSITELHAAFPRGKKKKVQGSPGQKPREILAELISQKLLRSVESKRQLQEVLVDFWFNHFNVDFAKGQVKWYIAPYERDVIRPHVFGKFRDLLGAVAKSPAMLFYLDNFQSVRDGFTQQRFSKRANKKARKNSGLNENYGRELLELHTLGVDGGYTQKDVRETARALTGWTLNQPQRSAEFIFRSSAHDEDGKQILGLTLHPGGGIDDGEKVLDMLAKQPATAHFIAKKLAVKFISDRPPESAIQKLAATFLRTGGDLRAVYAELFRLPEFWSPSARRSKVKTPWEFTVSAARALGATYRAGEGKRMRTLASLEQMGEPPYRCQPPTGFKDTSEFWVNPGALVTRINYSLALAAERLPEMSVDLEYFRKKLEADHIHDSGHELENSIDHLNHWILADELRQETRTRLVKELNSEERVMAESNLSKLLGLILGSPEFQRR